MSTATESSTRTEPLPLVQVGLIALFVTALVTAQVTASKILMFELPFSLPLVENSIILPGAAVAYAVTYFASDCTTELYGRRNAHRMVNVAFLMNFVLLALVWTTILAPVFPKSPVSAETFRSVMAASTGVVVGSLCAYLVSQNLDVFVFQRIRDRTGGRDLWLRTFGSTAFSQLVDTIIFITVAFVIFQGVPLAVAVPLAFGQYLVKILAAIVDVPFVYGVTRLGRRTDSTTRRMDPN